MTRKRLLDHLDDAARLTGVPKFAEHPMRRRHLRWLPLIAILLGGMGLALPMLGLFDSTMGYVLLMSAFTVSIALPAFGPLKPWGELIDEREHELRRSAYFATFATTTAVAVIGLMLLAGLLLIEHWPPLLFVQFAVLLTLLLVVLFNAVPTLYASWSTTPLSDDEEI